MEEKRGKERGKEGRVEEIHWRNSRQKDEWKGQQRGQSQEIHFDRQRQEGQLLLDEKGGIER